MNWPNPTSNAVGVRGDGLAWPDGIMGNETYQQSYALGQLAGNAILSQGGNTLRLPITPQMTVGTNWSCYKAVINGLTSVTCNVVLCYWSTNNQVSDLNPFYGMWDAVNSAFHNASNVLYEPINEPANQANLADLYAGFIARYNPKHNKCILDGAGYAQSVTGIGGDARLSNQLLGYHDYAWYYNTGNASTYYNDCSAGVGPYASRTVITETGVPTEGYPVVSYWQQYGSSLDPYVASLNGGLAWARDHDVGTIQWSGSDSQDYFHWFRSLHDLTVARLDVARMFQWAWGISGAPAGEKNLLTDTAFSPNSTSELNGNLTDRQTGLLAPASWTPDNQSSVQLGSPTGTGFLLNQGASIYVNSDFAPVVNTLNLPLQVNFLGSVAYDGGDPTTWFSLNIANSPTGWGPGSSEYCILFRENGGTQIFNGPGFPGNLVGSPNWGMGATNKYVSISVTFSDASGLGSPFSGNGTVVTASANGFPFSTNVIGQMSHGYLGFSVNGNTPVYNISALSVQTLVRGVAPSFPISPGPVTNWNGVPLTLSPGVVGSQPMAFQWYSNQVPVMGQTNSTLYLADPETTSSYVLRAANAWGHADSPTIQLHAEDPSRFDQMLFWTKGIAYTLSDQPPASDYIGEFFTTGSKPRPVTHLGYFDAGGTGPGAGHHVGIFQGETLVASVYVPAGTNSPAAYGYRWVPLPRPVTLLPNTVYFLFGDANSQDYWPNNFIPDWNSAYLGTNTVENYLTWNWDASPPFKFPQYPNSATLQVNQGWNDGHAFGNVNLGNFPMAVGRAGAMNQIAWTLGILQTSTNVTGGFVDVPGANSPYTIPADQTSRFYRLRML